MQDSITLSALAIVGTIVGALVWLLREQFKQNNTTIKESTKAINKLADVMDKFSETLATDEIIREKNQNRISGDLKSIATVLQKISTNQDNIKTTVDSTYKIVSKE